MVVLSRKIAAIFLEASIKDLTTKVISMLLKAPRTTVISSWTLITCVFLTSKRRKRKSQDWRLGIIYRNQTGSMIKKTLIRCALSAKNKTLNGAPSTTVYFYASIAQTSTKSMKTKLAKPEALKWISFSLFRSRCSKSEVIRNFKSSSSSTRWQIKNLIDIPNTIEKHAPCIEKNWLTVREKTSSSL